MIYRIRMCTLKDLQVISRNIKVYSPSQVSKDKETETTHQKGQHKQGALEYYTGWGQGSWSSHYKASAGQAQRRLTPSRRMIRPEQELVVKNCSCPFRSCTISATSSSTLPLRLRSALLKHCAFHLLNSALRSMRGGI